MLSNHSKKNRKTKMRRVDELDVPNTRVLVRSALNVPLQDSVVTNTFRLKKAVRTIQLLSERGAKVIVIGHLGRTKRATLAPVAEALSQYHPARFVRDVCGKEALESAEALSTGEVIMLENLRQKDGEVENSHSFAKALSQLADVYVNDAFPASHRRHASIVTVPLLMPHAAGLQLFDEVEYLSHARNPESESLCIIGGAKFETKVPLIKEFLNRYDKVFVGGAVVHDVFRAMGLSIGRSLSSPHAKDCEELLGHPNLLLPLDVIVRTKEGHTEIRGRREVAEDDVILDAGPESVELLSGYVKNAKTILWNGPLGNYEEGFYEQTEAIATLIAGCAAYSVVGGGDTVASIARLSLEDRFSFVSTGGGAMLEFLKEGTLPGIEALEH